MLHECSCCLNIGVSCQTADAHMPELVLLQLNESLRVGGTNFDGRAWVTEKWSKLRREVVYCYKLKMNLIAEGGL